MCVSLHPYKFAYVCVYINVYIYTHTNMYMKMHTQTYIYTLNIYTIDMGTLHDHRV